MIGGTSTLTSALQLEGGCQLRKKNPTPSPEAAANLSIQIIDLLLQAGADINLRRAFDSTALLKAASWSSSAVLKHLLLRGANPFAVEGESAPSQPLDCAIKSKRPEIATVLRAALERQRASTGPACPPCSCPFPKYSLGVWGAKRPQRSSRLAGTARGETRPCAERAQFHRPPDQARQLAARPATGYSSARHL